MIFESAQVFLRVICPFAKDQHFFKLCKLFPKRACTYWITTFNVNSTEDFPQTKQCRMRTLYSTMIFTEIKLYLFQQKAIEEYTRTSNKEL